jgi:two-component system, NtrC family, sensor kinase
MTRRGIRNSLRRILRRFDVVDVDSGARALEVLAADQGFDVILCDVMMPSVSGVDVHRWLAREHPALADRVIFLSGGTFVPAAREYLAKTCIKRIDKPLDADPLAALVAERVAAARSRDTSG